MNDAGGCGVERADRLVRMVLTPELPGQVCEVEEDLDVEVGRWYVVRTRDGERLATPARHEPPPLPPCARRVAGRITREATDEEVQRERDLVTLRQQALDYCRRRARELSLPVRPVTASTALDRSQLSITFSSEERVDVRELARDMSRWAQRRVDLRPVGVRDQAKASGGLGHCGRVLCCSTFMTRFSSVTVKMAKAQNLALNPARISGMCGRLMCCLTHEMPAGAGQRRGKSERKR